MTAALPRLTFDLQTPLWAAQEYKGNNRMSSMVSDEPWDEEDDAPELDIGGAPRVDLGWEMAQASNDDRGTRCVRRFFWGVLGC